MLHSIPPQIFVGNVNEQFIVDLILWTEIQKDMYHRLLDSIPDGIILKRNKSCKVLIPNGTRTFSFCWWSKKRRFSAPFGRAIGGDENRRFHEKEVVREFLKIDELQTIYRKMFPSDRLTLIRNVFVFAAVTRLVFIDGSNSPRNTSSRTKTEISGSESPARRQNRCNIPMLNIPQEILRKYIC